jgi:hypothetical protein
MKYKAWEIWLARVAFDDIPVIRFYTLIFRLA